MHRNVFSLITGRLALATLLLTVCATETFGQLDERWAVTINGQTVQVEPDGSFLLSNVSAPDVFGPGGPGTGPDNFADDVYRLTGVRTTGSGTLYVYSPNAVRIKPNGLVTFSLGSLKVTPFAPVLPQSIILQVGCDPSAPMECGSVFAVGKRRSLSVTATLSDPLLDPDFTLPSKRTTYRASNINIARIVGDDPDLNQATTIDIEGVSPGVAFITATNGGATSVVKITVANPGNLISTTVEGFVRRIDAASASGSSPVNGADITVRTEDGSQVIRCLNCTGAEGSFSIGPVLLLDTTTGVVAEAKVSGSVTELNSSASVSPVANGITDMGIITIDVVCNTPWSTAFGPSTFDLVDSNGSRQINAFAVFDDGTGPALYVAGWFDRAGGVPANDIAKWNGRSWEPVGGGISPGPNGSLGDIKGMTVVDLGDGPALYVVGSFVMAGGVGATHVAKWDGQSWSALNGGVGEADYNYGTAVMGFDDQTGNAMELYVGGLFAKVGNIGANGSCNGQCIDAPYIAKWNPSTGWSPVGDGFDRRVFALSVYDEDGPGGAPPRLFAGGEFSNSGATPVRRIARWDGVTWTQVGVGGGGLIGSGVTSLTVFDDGSGIGTSLYVGGSFSNADTGTDPFPVNIELHNVARWNGSSWSALGSAFDNDVLALAGFDDGVNKILYASGLFKNVRGGGVPGLNRVAQWNGTNWLPLGTGIESNGTALSVFDDGSGLALYAAGRVCVSGCIGASAAQSSELDGKRRGSPHRLSVSAAAAVYQGYVARWKMDEWSVPSNGLNDEVRALIVFDDDGSGVNLPALYSGGRFTSPLGPRDDNAAPFPTNAIAKFDGTKWSSLATGLTNYDTDLPLPNPLPQPAEVHALAVFDEDGTNPNPPRLFAGGTFTFAGGVPANHVARWDGTNWSAVGTIGDIVEALTVFDDATGAALFAGGMFPGGIKVWDGAAWTTLGGGVTGSVFTAAVFNGELYIGGSFTDAGSVGGPGFLARWDGSTWSAVGSGVNGSVYALTVFDDGNGSALFAGGEFLMPVAGGITANRVAKWDGVAWSALSDGLGPTSVSAIRVDTLLSFDDGSGPFLYAGGDFTTAAVPGGGTIPLNRLAKWNPILDEWSAVGVSSQMGSDPGGGVDGTGSVAVRALAVFDDGTNGSALFAGGAFETASGTPSSNIAKLGCR